MKDIFTGLLIGITIGIFFILSVATSNIGAYVKKSDIIEKRTVLISNCYEQYSAVRRFPK